jgi:hypothetical protein
MLIPRSQSVCQMEYRDQKVVRDFKIKRPHGEEQPFVAGDALREHRGWQHLQPTAASAASWRAHVEVAQKEAGKALGVPCFEEMDGSNKHMIDRRGQVY